MTATASAYGSRPCFQAVLWSVLLVPLLALSSPAFAETFAVDVYVATLPVEGESFNVTYYEGGAVQVPKDALGDKGTAKFDSRFEGADGLKKSIDDAFADANKKFADAGVKFEVRNIYFISADQKDLKPFYQGGENQLFSLGMKDGKSALLDAFDKTTAGTKGAFRVLMAPIEEHKEVGIAQTPGTVSVIDAASATKASLNGFGLVHELSHNLGVEKHHGDPLTTAMAEGVPDPQRGQEADPKLDPDEIATIKKAVATGRYKDVLMGAGASATDERSDTKKTDTKKAATPKSEQKKSATPSQDKQRKTTGAAKRDLGKVIQFGVGVGLGAATSSGGSSKQKHRNEMRR